MSQTTPETLNRFKCEHRRAGRRTIAIRYTALMGILIGMDEAGYGPHLGPLAIAATAWELRGDASPFTNGEPASAGGGNRRRKRSHAGAHAGVATLIKRSTQSAIRSSTKLTAGNPK